MITVRIDKNSIPDELPYTVVAWINWQGEGRNLGSRYFKTLKAAREYAETIREGTREFRIIEPE